MTRALAGLALFALSACVIYSDSEDTGASTTDTHTDTPGDPDDSGPPPTDRDGDGYSSDVDCDDSDGDVNPGATERCDGADNNCDGVIDEGTWHRDDDGDGYGGAPITACRPADAGSVLNGDDCDDSDKDVNPDAAEICDEIDNDCDGAIDPEGTPGLTILHPDADGDGHGDADSSATVCEGAAGYTSDASDCDDRDAAVFDTCPTESDCTDGVDSDRDGLLDCEDDDCESSAACTELDCGDGLDDDDDGYADCDDTDCWGTGCPDTTRVRLRGGDVRGRLTVSLTRYAGSSIEPFTTTYFSAGVQGEVWGDVQVYTAGGGRTTCDFVVDHLSGSTTWFGEIPDSSAYRASMRVNRSGTSMDADCGALSDLLPGRLEAPPRYAQRGRFYLPSGDLWYAPMTAFTSSASPDDFSWFDTFPVAPAVHVLHP